MRPPCRRRWSRRRASREPRSLLRSPILSRTVRVTANFSFANLTHGAGAASLGAPDHPRHACRQGLSPSPLLAYGGEMKP